MSTSYNRSNKSLYERRDITINTGKEKKEPTRITVNRAVRQECSLSPTLFNIYTEYVVRQWKQQTCSGIYLLPNNFSINTAVC